MQWGKGNYRYGDTVSVTVNPNLIDMYLPKSILGLCLIMINNEFSDDDDIMAQTWFVVSVLGVLCVAITRSVICVHCHFLLTSLSLVFSERELTFMFAICYRPSVRLSVTFVHCTLLSRLTFSAIFLRRLVGLPWPSVGINGKFYGDRPRGTLPSGGGRSKRKRGSQI